MAQINKPNQYFNTKLYTGNGAAARGITGVGFQPDWVWVKDRSVGYPHITWDSVRTNKASLCTNTTAAEVTTTARTLTSFDSDGFTTPNVTGDIFNDNGTAFVSWNWKAGGSASSNTDGSITSSVSANTTSGFSIVSFTGTGANATVGHGLGVAPKMIIVKGRSFVDNWCVFHSSLGGGKKLRLNTTGAEISTTEAWNSTSPTSSVFSVGADGETNNNGSTMIAYCFAEKQGYSKFGSYTGNGNANGTFVYTGFKPAWIMLKRTDGVNDWILFDSKRLGYNGDNKRLYPNQAYVEDTTGFDLLSNGFKARMTGTTINGSGNSYIYMAFAENPLVGTNNIPATAR